MVNDREQQLYQDMADLREKVPKLQTEVKSLKAKLTKLSNRIENLELLALQDQISKLSDKVVLANKDLIKISRELAGFNVNFTQYFMKDRIEEHLQSPIREQIKERINSLFIKALKDIEYSNKSDEPITIAGNFMKECNKISKQYKLKAFKD